MRIAEAAVELALTDGVVGAGRLVDCSAWGPVELRHAFVADAAQSTPDGKIWVLGGDFDTITCRRIPAVHPAMALVVKILVQPPECGRRHRLRVELINPDGTTIQDPITVDFEAEPNPTHPHRPVGVGLVANFFSLTFPATGEYGFHVLVDDLPLGRVPLYVAMAGG